MNAINVHTTNTPSRGRTRPVPVTTTGSGAWEIAPTPPTTQRTAQADLVRIVSIQVGLLTLAAAALAWVVAAFG